MYYETSDVARALGVSDATIRLWEREGRIDPPGRTPGGRRIFTEQELTTIRERYNARRVDGRRPGNQGREETGFVHEQVDP